MRGLLRVREAIRSDPLADLPLLQHREHLVEGAIYNMTVLRRKGAKKHDWFAGVQPVDGVFADFRDDKGLKREAEAARREGFTGKLAIHPAQVPIINAAFTPSKAEIHHAEAVVAAFEANPHAGTVSIAGKMADRPHLEQARRVLGRARGVANDA